jgi:2-oxoisovalerate dehydrogenase E1 component beta subunit
VADVTMVAALNRALADSLRDDDRVLVFGEDVGKLGGVFRVTDGLQAEFGEERVFDTPLAESAIAGVSLGLALAGWKPVSEMQFDGFSYPALDQVISHWAKYRYRSRGRQPVPAVMRIPFAGGIGAAEHHSESPETYYAHTAGLKVVVPATPLDAYNLLVRSIRDPDPVVFLEPKSRYWSKESGDLSAEGLPIGRARLVREGTDCVIVSYGAMVARSLTAATRLAGDGVEAAVLDLRTLVPLDIETLGEAVRGTGRAVVVH